MGSTKWDLITTHPQKKGEEVWEELSGVKIGGGVWRLSEYTEWNSQKINKNTVIFKDISISYPVNKVLK